MEIHSIGGFNMSSQLLGPIIIFLIPAFILSYFAIEIYMRNKNSAMNRTTSLLMLCALLVYLSQYFIHTYPLPYSSLIARYGLYPFSFLLMSFGLMFFSSFRNERRTRSLKALCWVPALFIPVFFLSHDKVQLHYFENELGRAEYRSWTLDIILAVVVTYTFVMILIFLTMALRASSGASTKEQLRNRKRVVTLISGLASIMFFSIITIWVLPYLIPGLLNFSSLSLLLWVLTLRYIMIRHDFLPSFERRFQTLFELTPMGILLLNSQGRIIEANSSVCRLLGVSITQLRRASFSCYVREEDQPGLEALSNLTEGQTNQMELRLLTKSDTEITALLECEMIEMEYANILIVILSDITEKKQYEERIAYMAYRDELTGLYNRSYFNQTVVHCLEESQPERNKHALIMIDLDRFKMINDTLGHYAGDELIKYVAELISRHTRPQDIVARFGGDEFVIFIRDYETLEDVVQTNESILESFMPPFVIENREFEVSGSIGISLYPSDGVDKNTLLKHADIAMYKTKNSGRSHYSFFNASMRSNSLDMESDLRSALKNEEFILYYQPQYRLSDMSLIGFEALIRWNSPTEGLILPGKFIPMAEESGLIVPLGYWALEQACLESIRCTNAGLNRDLIISVNISPKQFLLPDFSLKVSDIVRRTGVDPSTLCLEITESTTIDDISFSLYQCRQIEALGIRIAMDDFGTGFSSLGLLQKFPFRDIKIDRSFTMHIESQPEQKAIVEAIIRMSHSMGLFVIAEGIETEAQRDKLAELGCNAVQGFLTGRPMPAEQAMELVREQQLV
jgi:diguanylate cyclase (GGDEF)-like protein/PAS domain S-box-containing protein